MYTADVLYQRLTPYLMKDSQLSEHGFPRADSKNPGTAVISISQLDKNHVSSTTSC